MKFVLIGVLPAAVAFECGDAGCAGPMPRSTAITLPVSTEAQVAPETNVKVDQAAADQQMAPETIVKVDRSTMGQTLPYWWDMAVADQQAAPETIVKVDRSTMGQTLPYWWDMAVADQQAAPTHPPAGFDMAVVDQHVADHGTAGASPHSQADRMVKAGTVPQWMIAAFTTRNLPDSSEDHIDTSKWPSLNQFPSRFKNYMEPLQNSVLFFQSAEGLDNFLQSENKFGRIPLVTNRSLLDQRVKLLSVVDIPWRNVLLVCHKDDGGVCHLPLRTQRFFVAASLFQDGHVENLMFTEHKMNPTCNPDCNFMHHVVEYALFPGIPQQNSEQFLM